MADQGPIYLRWRAGRPMPEQEQFETLDAALDAAEARWETLQHQAAQILDARRVLVLSTAELAAIVVESLAGTEGESRA